MKIILFSFVFLAGFGALANESGVIINGKKIVQYVDGVKVASADAAVNEASEKRKPSGKANVMEGVANSESESGSSGYLYYQTVDNVTCYSTHSANVHRDRRDTNTLSCVRTK